MAQLEARLDGIEEVEGSNPFGSTTIFATFCVCILRIDSKDLPAYVLRQNSTLQQPGDNV